MKTVISSMVADTQVLGYPSICIAGLLGTGLSNQFSAITAVVITHLYHKY